MMRLRQALVPFDRAKPRNVFAFRIGASDLLMIMLGSA